MITSKVIAEYSNQLSYTKLSLRVGIEPTTVQVFFENKSRHTFRSLLMHQSGMQNLNHSLILSNFIFNLTLHTYYLLKGMYYLDKVILCLHDSINIFISFWRLINDAFIFSTFDSLRVVKMLL